MNQNETIAAIATGLTNSGIGIIRISGECAIAAADMIFHANNGLKVTEMKSHTIHYGFIFDKEEMIDEVMLLIMKAPNSFTREDTIEIDCHGGVFVMKRILEIVLKNGVRPAEPGEFTKRAFLNGRIDLTKAEAIMDLIQCKNEYALSNSIGQVRGSLYEKITKIREEILYEIAFIESALDDPEHISLERYPEKLENVITEIIKKLKELIETFENGRIIQEGIRTVIVGKPNVGKSSLLNILAGEERAIVTEIAGTTRDVLEENVRIRGLQLKLLDTAGIRETEDLVEKIGVERARKYADEADLIIDVVDASCEMDENDLDIFGMIKDKKAIILLNKTDLKQIVTEEDIRKKTDQTIISVSVKNNIGLDAFENEIWSLFEQDHLTYNDEVLITNIRQKNAMEEAVESLKLVMTSIHNGMPEDFYSIDLMNAYERIGSIIGESVEEDLVNEIFAKFCMGK